MEYLLKALSLSLLLPVVLEAVSHCGNKSAFSDDSDNIHVLISDDGSYHIKIRDTVWLKSAPTFFNVDGQSYVQNKALKLLAKAVTNGTDSLGQFRLVTFRYMAGKTNIMTSIKTYEGLPLMFFTQGYLDSANDTKAKTVDQTISGFPSFDVVEVKTRQGPLGYLAYGGVHCADTGKHFGIFGPAMMIVDGLADGPLVLFDGSGDAIVISPSRNVMAAASWHQQDRNGISRLVYGIMGEVNTVPADTMLEFILYYSSAGVNKAMEGWGNCLQCVNQRTDFYLKNDMTVNYLGYYTDNGAYYYYQTEPGHNYQDTVLDVITYADKIGIPYRYVQYDSWWYYKGVGDGVKTWEAMPDIFPSGLQYVYNKTGLRPVAHNRYWSNDTTYATENGGRYNFVVETTGISVPNDQAFWNDLLANATNWGLYTYEQDWLSVQFAGMEAMRSSVSLGTTWLNQMARAAAMNNIMIQYCTANARHILQALENPVVTQARVSKDYKPGSDQWKIGVSSMFAQAVGIAPFKDNFWTTTDEPGNKYKGREPNNELQLVVSVLSTGPVAPSDGIGYTNVTLVMRCCNAEGLILKPSKPATAIDDQIYKRAFNFYPSSNGEVWSTFSVVSSLMFGIILVPEINGQYDITPGRAGFWKNQSNLMVFEAHNVTKLEAFSEKAPLRISGCTTTRPCIYHVTPVLKQSPQVVLLGELAKIVPVSPQRITEISVRSDDVMLYTQGAPNERVDFTFSVDSKLVTVTCKIGSSRTAVANLSSRKCR